MFKISPKPTNFNMYPQSVFMKKYEPVHEKTNNLGFQPGLTQTRLYRHRRQLEA